MTAAPDASPWLRPVDAAADAALLAELHAEGFEAPWPAEAMAAVLLGPGVSGLLAGDGVAADAMLLLRAVAGEAEVLTLAVRVAARGRGLGAALLAAGARLAQAAGAEVLWLEVAQDNPAALALYRRAGFEPAGRRPRYYARPDGVAVDALLMRRPLNTSVA